MCWFLFHFLFVPGFGMHLDQILVGGRYVVKVIFLVRYSNLLFKSVFVFLDYVFVQEIFVIDGKEFYSRVWR